VSSSPPTPRRLLEPDHCTPRTTSPSLYRHIVYMLCNERNDKVQKHACMITNTMARIHKPRIKHSMDDDRSYISKSNIDRQGITSLGKLRFTHTNMVTPRPRTKLDDGQPHETKLDTHEKSCCLEPNTDPEATILPSGRHNSSLSSTIFHVFVTLVEAQLQR
jgi:hypothetical protein